LGWTIPNNVISHFIPVYKSYKFVVTTTHNVIWDDDDGEDVCVCEKEKKSHTTKNNNTPFIREVRK
jgi:hypothetical protein